MSVPRDELLTAAGSRYDAVAKVLMRNGVDIEYPQEVKHDADSPGPNAEIEGDEAFQDAEAET